MGVNLKCRRTCLIYREKQVRVLPRLLVSHVEKCLEMVIFIPARYVRNVIGTGSGGIMSRLDEEVALQQFHDEIIEAWKKCQTSGPGGKRLSNFFFGQKLRRLVREAMIRYGDSV
jgi:hypothetical protein